MPETLHSINVITQKYGKKVETSLLLSTMAKKIQTNDEIGNVFGSFEYDDCECRRLFAGESECGCEKPVTVACVGFVARAVGLYVFIF